MITVRDDASRNEHTRLAWALFASAAVNLLLWPLLIWLFGMRLALVPQNPAREQFIVASSSVRIEHRVVPQPKQAPHRSVPTAKAQVIPHVVAHQPPAQHHEIARETQNAPPQPPPAKREATLAQTLAKQEQDFARETQEMHANNNPLSIATIAPQLPSSYQRSYMDLSGRDQQEHVFAVLTVREKFQTASLHCYYVRYDAQFSGGGTDDGTIPWPVCFPKDRDAMLPLDRPHLLPVPAPQPGYVLPPGTALSPLLREIYEHQIQG